MDFFPPYCLREKKADIHRPAKSFLPGALDKQKLMCLAAKPLASKQRLSSSLLPYVAAKCQSATLDPSVSYINCDVARGLKIKEQGDHKDLFFCLS